MKVLLAATAGLLLVAAAIVGGALLADVLVDDSPTSSTSLVAPGVDPLDTVVEPLPMLAEDPPRGLPGGTYVTETGLIDDAVVPDDAAVDLLPGAVDSSDGETPNAAPDGDGSEAESGPPTSEPDSADEPRGEPPALAEEVPDLPSDPIRPTGAGVWFRDECADAPAPGCPSGVGGTIETLASDAPFRIKIYPQLTRGVYPALRCDPGFESTSRVPVVVTSNAPLGSGRVSAITTSDERHESYETKPDERAWFESQSTSGATVGFGLDGVQHCMSLPIPVTTGPSAGDVVSFEVRATGRTADGERAVDQVTVQFRTSGPRPSTGIFPRWWNEVQVVMAQQDPGQGYATSVKPIARSGPGRQTRTCESVAGFPRSPWPISDGKAAPGDPQPIPEAVRVHPDYTNDPSFTHQAVWNVLLQEGTRYSLCLSWVDGEGLVIETEEWLVEPPNQFRFELVATGYSQNMLDNWALMRGYRPDGPPSDWSNWYLHAGLPGCDEVRIPRGDPSLCASGVWGSGGPAVVIRYGQLDGAGKHFLPEAIGVESPVRACLDQEHGGEGCDGLELAGPTVNWHHHTVRACPVIELKWPGSFDGSGIPFWLSDEEFKAWEECGQPPLELPVTSSMKTEWHFHDGPHTDGTGPRDWRWWLAGTEPPTS